MKPDNLKIIEPDWPAPVAVRAFTSTRVAGFSQPPHASLNLALHVDDEKNHVTDNRSRLKRQMNLPAEPFWLQQVHGTTLLNLDRQVADNVADGCFTESAGRVCAVMTADCLPILMCSQAGDKVAALHAGWRGLAAGVIGEGVAAMAMDAEQLLVWLGPAIGPNKFEVGIEVFRAFVDKNPAAEEAFQPTREGHWNADLYNLARLQFGKLGVQQVYGGNYCTYTDIERFYSFRRDGITGRMASLIWLQDEVGD